MKAIIATTLHSGRQGWPRLGLLIVAISGCEIRSNLSLILWYDFYDMRQRLFNAAMNIAIQTGVSHPGATRLSKAMFGL
jgi:hypothetical protein